MTYPPDRRGLRGPILTIDGSLSQTGWALTGEHGQRLQSGVFRSKAGLPADQRIYIIGQQLMQLWPKLVQKPKHFGIEHQFFRQAAPGAKFQLRPEVVADLARLEGVLIFIAKNASPDIDVMALRSTEWRGLLGVRPERRKKGEPAGPGMKHRGLERIRLLLSRQMPISEILQMPEDEVEAIGLSLGVYKELSSGYPLRQRREELKAENVAKKIRKKAKAACKPK